MKLLGNRVLQTILTCALCLLCAPVRAELRPAQLNPLPRQKLIELAPLLRTGNLALLESDERGAMRQITTLSLVAAPPQVVRDAVMHAERYGDFVRNMSESRVSPRADGSFDHRYAISLSIQKVTGHHVYSFPKDDVVDVIDMADADEPGVRHYRWEFVPVGGGTLIVVYGYTPIPNSGVMGKLLQRVPTLEYGMALMTQLTLVLAMKDRAESLVRAPVELPAPGGSAAGYQFMLDRGLVAMLRTVGGRLSDISLVGRVQARPDVLMQVVEQPSQWAQFVPSITRSASMGAQEGVDAIELEQSVPLMSWKTVFGMRKAKGAVDMMGLSGDMRGARLRWDVRTDSSGHTELVMRTNQAFERTSLLLRQLYKAEPLFEYGVNVGLDLPVVLGVKGRAEQLMAASFGGGAGGLGGQPVAARR